jgi:hypothetical protein
MNQFCDICIDQDINVAAADDAVEVSGSGTASGPASDRGLCPTKAENIASSGVRIERKFGRQLLGRRNDPCVNRVAEARKGLGKNAASTMERWNVLPSCVVTISWSYEFFMLNSTSSEDDAGMIHIWTHSINVAPYFTPRPFGVTSNSSKAIIVC